MPHKCWVPNCKGNYTTGPKVRVFSFPKDEALKNAWRERINRKDFPPSPASKICERHFEPSALVYEASAFDWKTNRTLTAPLKRPRLKKGAIPTIFPKPPIPKSKSVSSSQPSKKPTKRKKLKSSVEAVPPGGDISGTKPSETVQDPSTSALQTMLICCSLKKELIEENLSSTNNECIRIKEEQLEENEFTSKEKLIEENPSPAIYEYILIKEEPFEENEFISEVSFANSESNPSHSTPSSIPGLPVNTNSGVENELSTNSEILKTFLTNPMDLQSVTSPHVYATNSLNANPDDLQYVTPFEILSQIPDFNICLQEPTENSKPLIGTTDDPAAEVLSPKKPQCLSKNVKEISTANSKTSEDSSKDLFDLFGEYVAANLRKLNCKSCNKALTAITDIIYEANKKKKKKKSLHKKRNH